MSSTNNTSTNLTLSDNSNSASNKHVSNPTITTDADENKVLTQSAAEVKSDTVQSTGTEATDVKQKAPGVTFNCELCNVQCSSEEVFQMHLKGQKHQKKLRRKQELEQYGIIDKVRNSDTYCKLCSVELTSKTHMLLHLSGRRHKQNLMKELSSKNTESEQTAKQVEEFEKKQKQEEERLIKQAGISDFSKYEIPADRKTQALAEGAKNEFFCSICTKYFSGKTQLAMHLISTRHKEKEFPHLRLRRAGVGQSSRGAMRGGYRGGSMSSNFGSYRGGSFKQQRYFNKNALNDGRFERTPSSLYSSNSFNFSSDFSPLSTYKSERFDPLDSNISFRSYDYQAQSGNLSNPLNIRSFNRNRSFNQRNVGYPLTLERNSYLGSSTDLGYNGGIKPMYSTYQSRVDYKQTSPNASVIGGRINQPSQFSSSQWQSDQHNFNDSFVGNKPQDIQQHQQRSYWNDFGGNSTHLTPGSSNTGYNPHNTFNAASGNGNRSQQYDQYTDRYGSQPGFSAGNKYTSSWSMPNTSYEPSYMANPSSGNYSQDQQQQQQHLAGNNNNNSPYYNDYNPTSDNSGFSGSFQSLNRGNYSQY